MDKKRILIVEDEFIIAETIKRSLHNLGYEVTSTVDTGEEAVVKALLDKPDITLMDITLKGEMDGIVAAHEIKRTFHCPVIFLTAHVDEELIERAKITEPFGYIVKPFKENELQAAIEVALYKVKMENALKELNRNLENKVDRKVKELRRQEQLLIQQSKMAAMGEMIGAIAHQWRQPLNALGIIVQDLKDAYDFGELDKKYIDDMVRESINQIQFMSKTIDDFRNFYRTSKEKETFSIIKAIKSVILLQEAQFKHNRINIGINSDINESLSVTGYPNEFKQVVLNILGNARSAILDAVQDGFLNEEKGEISINISKGIETVIIEISNRGKNIPDGIIDKIFEPYFTTKKTGNGTGIGLYMAKTIIEKHMAGKLYVENIENGVTFTIALNLN